MPRVGLFLQFRPGKSNELPVTRSRSSLYRKYPPGSRNRWRPGWRNGTTVPKPMAAQAIARFIGQRVNWPAIGRFWSRISARATTYSGSSGISRSRVADKKRRGTGRRGRLQRPHHGRRLRRELARRGRRAPAGTAEDAHAPREHLPESRAVHQCRGDPVPLDRAGRPPVAALHTDRHLASRYGWSCRKKQITSLVSKIDAFMPEDKAVIEQVQRGLASGTPSAGIPHPFEQTNREFGHYVARMAYRRHGAT